MDTFELVQMLREKMRKAIDRNNLIRDTITEKVKKNFIHFIGYSKRYSGCLTVIHEDPDTETPGEIHICVRALNF